MVYSKEAYNIEDAVSVLDGEDYASVVNYIEFLKTRKEKEEKAKYKWEDGILYMQVQPGDCWTRADKKAALEEWEKVLEHMKTAPRTGPVEHSWTREELYDRQ